MSQKLKSKVNAIFVQLNRYTRQRKDFAAEAFLRDLDSYFGTLDRVDLSGEVGRKLDEQLKTRVNTIARNADPLVKVVADLMVLYFWYIRRPGTECSNSLVAVKKMRGQTDDSYFIENGLAPLVFDSKLKGIGKRENRLRDLLLRRGSLVAASFTESDHIPSSATRVVRSDSWQKKMLHLSALHQAGRLSEVSAVLPREELRQICNRNRFARWYLSSNSIYQPQSAFWLSVRQALSHFGSLLLTPFNLRFVIHLFRNRLPVYLVYLLIAAVFVFGAVKMKDLWQTIHADYLESLPTLSQQVTEGD
jgi:hypothetical protein